MLFCFFQHFIIYCFVLGGTVFAQENVGVESNIGVTKEMFSDVNIRDAKASIELWAKMIHESFTSVKKSTTYIYENMNDLANDINNDNVDYVFMSAAQYLKNKSLLKITPYYGTTLNKEKFFDLLLLTKNDKPVKSFKDLKNLTITVQGGRYKMLSELWLDYLCLQNGIGDKEKFFKKILYEDNASKTILNTFFNKSDICIVTSSTLNVMSELNPQVKKTLQIVYKKQNLINDLFCLRNNLADQLRKKTLMFGKEIVSKPKTLQVYKIFKIDGSYLINDSDLSTTIELWDSFNKLKNKK